MCNLYSLRRTPDEVAHLFGASAIDARGAAAEVDPGYPGLVFAAGELRSMLWAFRSCSKASQASRSTQAGEQYSGGQARQYHVALQLRRVPLHDLVTEFAEAEGEKGAMTRTWFSLPMSRCSRWRASGATRRSGAGLTAWS
jgi:putative SOS response-associated peptidase YedK